MVAIGADLEQYTADLHKKFPKVATLTTSQLAAQLRAHPPLLLDARAAKEFAVSHISGAIRIQSDVLTQLQSRAVPKDRAVVVYCSVGYRSALIVEQLRQAGFTNVHNLDGSLFAWANEGRPLVNANGSTTGVHPFNLLWGRYLNRNHWRWKPDKIPTQ